MAKKEIDDYLQEGIYGRRELNPDERKAYLGTLRERIVLVLKQSEVRGKKGLRAIEQTLQQHPNARMLMNGHMSFRFFKPYRNIANQYNISYTSVSNQEAKSDYGIVITLDSAIEKENIFLNEDKPRTRRNSEEKKSWWKKLLGF
ncbi:hypothetical protein J416_10606 [Gracilibacillus halophilus YIM-C55.5]|uniref:DUF1694 domain-containing protein n=1 Tax=Gracilibacillus halophilus YIM-C55.5 TaxID=1308866 RepID=N4WJV8_9BACI|nr:YueI family protein [Gracilibacillus halophilus]ENH96457.1 hypothetical protein J416_10606 [Gracilibacillus halophilus YIM-C55.5]